MSEVKASLIYRLSSGTAKDTQKNPVSKNKTKQQQQTEKTKQKTPQRPKKETETV